ncbi:MAG: phosphatase PAP2 family protein [Ignavibacteriales bacterium]|nr:MAG: phosphatase PAP2 family protein [Ignavibacteriaceae bacterium]MBW7874134.1 phosphatase PAP2 family protein [Ignavibacteria bacterium]MCZ2142909.1 phosphatase PAP2 family protein [Ignavibacteriales bacterium]OQY78299.1 MAG: phosphatase PAP2 family protein [Ignavibacteriales bacterium UTCHB3]MBV6444537.1 hypothetical protein [Ignavibacteriaceae bacterium]
MEFLFETDKAIFFFFNHTLSCGALDRFFTILTDVNSWFITYILLVGILLTYGGKRGRIAVVMVILLVFVCDQFGARFLKEWVARPRPFDFLTDVYLPAGKAGAYSFPSNHALNNFAVAVFFSILYPKFKWILYTVAALIALSRLYVGVHYPSDVLAGALIGSAIGYGFARLQILFERKQGFLPA